MVGTLPTGAVVTITVALLVLAGVGLWFAHRGSSVVGVAIVVASIVCAWIVAGDGSMTIGGLIVGAFGMGAFADARARAETPEARRGPTIGLVIFGIAMAAVVVLMFVRDLAPPATQKLVLDTLGGSTKAALALAEVPDEELVVVCREMAWLRVDLARTVEDLVDRETMAGLPTQEEQDRLRALSRRLAEIASEDASPGG